jgi:hypothetical protein
MFENLRRSGPPASLLDIITAVRSRWRLKLALRGAMAVAAVAVGLFLVAAYGMEWARFSTASIVAARILLGVTLAAAVVWFLVRPLRKQVTDEQVALYLEEHEPSLQATLLSAVEASRSGGNTEASRALVQRVVEQAVDACARTDAARRIEEVPLRRYGVAIGGIALATLLAVGIGPAFLRHAAGALLLLSQSVQAAVPYTISVTPGDASVPKGSDQTITAKLNGFTSEGAVLMVRRSPTTPYESVPLGLTESGAYEAMVFDVMEPLEYYVEAERVRSATHTLTVVEIPYAQRVELEFHFPAYTGLEPQKIEDGGDIAVLRGAEVRLRVVPTMKTPGGTIVLNDKEKIGLALQADGTLTASFKANQDGFYRIELVAPTGETVAGSPQYTIDVLDDQAPNVSFARPGRDTTASPIEELYVEAQAEDDFGIRDLELVYSVNGGEEKLVKLFNGSRRLAEVSAGHTIYLEELKVEPGDSVSYYARAADNDGVAGAKRASSDLYFVRIRPFSRDFRQAQSQGGGGGGGGGGGNQVTALSEQQRQVIAATFNINRDRRSLSQDKLRENSRIVSLSQSRLREQVEGLLTRMNSQLVERDPAFAKIAEMLPQAVQAMKDAEGQLSAAKPETAIKPEQQALQILQKAEEEYEMQVSVSRQQGGGGGGGGGAMQQELAELFEQELDQMASRYETASQATQQAADREVDELLEKLKELARRQQQEAERQRRRALEGQMSSGGNAGAQQRALAEQIEEAARRLERLAREEQRPDLQQAARDAQEAANAARRAAAGGDANAAAQASAALQKLQEAERRLQRNQTQRAERDIQDAQRKIDEIAREQQQIANAAGNLPSSPGQRGQQARDLMNRRAELAKELDALEGQLDRGARDAANTERAASRKMAEAAGAIRDSRVSENVTASQELIRRGTLGQIADAESRIGQDIQQVRERLEEAQQALGQGNPGDRQQNASERAEQLARRAESLQERTRERAQRNAQNGQRGQQGREGQQGQQGQRGEQGQDGREGQQGQNGQQGQGQQGQEGQGQQGQGGQGGQDGQRGGEGQRGGVNAEGLRDGGFVNGGLDRGGVWNGGEWGGWWNGARLGPDDIRQLTREARQFNDDLRQLRGELRGIEGIDPRELDQISRDLQRLEDDRIYQDVEELARLQSAITENLKRFEFNLRRQTNADANAAALTGADEVPEAYRKLAEQYTRSLARTPR